MSTIGVPLSLGGTRTSGTPVRTQNGLLFFFRSLTMLFVWSTPGYISPCGFLSGFTEFTIFKDIMEAAIC